ncbi:hypothetical protein E6C70_12775 [Glaciibacter flavus]|uniref:Uncharacterized protein n=1 Tax=Orlajensenia flava TaxID=2565934 RepID=A0A4S4FPU4_9MICO|nr:hypothetical protein E6C70_12775 [Glaciibacter flavus]
MSSRSARVVRGLVAALVATLTAALFHVAGGGAVPGVLAVTLSLSFSALACIALAGRALNLWRLAASVVFSQFLFHALFSLSGSGTVLSTSAHLHAGEHIQIVAGFAPSMAGMAHDTTLMWASHLAAAAVTIAALRFGERAFWGLWEFTALSVRRVLRPVVMVGLTSVRVPVDSRPASLPHLDLIIGSMRHRGPPAGAIAHG